MYFSVFIPLFNREKTVGRTLEYLVLQDFKDFEVIVVDDGSTDNSADVVNKFSDRLNIRYFYKANGGKHTALNKGIEMAEGTFFIICDSDDWLIPSALTEIYIECEKIKDNDEFSGVMFRTVNSENNQLIGDDFPESPFVSSYIDYHYISGMKKRYLDCCEANKTAILKNYRFPEPENTKFVPEAYVFDQVGLKYKLLCINRAIRYTEYMSDGMTNDKKHYDKNAVGYLYNYVSKIDDIFPNTKVSLKAEIIVWWKYWQLQKKCPYSNKPKVKRITFLGAVMYVMTPFINLIKK